eukprot:4606064-Prymnesium_polylepis.1
MSYVHEYAHRSRNTGTRLTPPMTHRRTENRRGHRRCAELKVPAWLRLYPQKPELSACGIASGAPLTSPTKKRCRPQALPAVDARDRTREIAARPRRPTGIARFGSASTQHAASVGVGSWPRP